MSVRKSYFPDNYCLFIFDHGLQKVQHELLTQYEQQLLEKEHSGCRALLRDDKVVRTFGGGSFLKVVNFR